MSKWSEEVIEANIKRIKKIPDKETGHPNPESWRKGAIEFWENQRKGGK